MGDPGRSGGWTRALFAGAALCVTAWPGPTEGAQVGPARAKAESGHDGGPAVAALASAADRPEAVRIDTAVAVRRGERLVLRVPEGSVRIEPGSEAVVRVVGEYEGGDRWRSLPRIGREAGVVDVRLPSEHDEWRVSVPPWLPVELVGREVDAVLVGLGGGVVARSGDGDLEARELSGVVDLYAVRGEIRVVDAEGELRLGTGDGEIDLERVGGRTVTVETTDGDIRMSGMFAERVEATTVDGDVLFEGRFVPGGRYQLGTHDGDIVVALAPDADVRVRATTYDGDFEPGFPVTIDGFRSGEPTLFTLGEGRAELILSSFSGDVRVVRNGGFDTSNEE